jgi:hypothetical protein
MKLDLHGINYSEVEQLVEDFIHLNQEGLPHMIVCGNSKHMIDLVHSVTTRIGCQVALPTYGTIRIDKI